MVHVLFDTISFTSIIQHTSKSMYFIEIKCQFELRLVVVVLTFKSTQFKQKVRETPVFTLVLSTLKS